jgi:chromosome segregation ATPase
MRTVIPLKYQILLILFLLVIVIVPSCVSKKKFVAMTNTHTLSEKKANDFREENDILRSDFESYRNSTENELIQKQRMIDSLKMNINMLNSDITTKKGNIEDQIFSFQLETGRLSQQLNEKEKEIRNLTREINTLKIQVDDLTRELENAKSGFKFPFGNVKQLERKIQVKDQEIAFLDSSLNSAKEEIILLNVKVDQQTITIENLSSQKDPINSEPVQK